MRGSITDRWRTCIVPPTAEAMASLYVTFPGSKSPTMVEGMATWVEVGIQRQEGRSVSMVGEQWEDIVSHCRNAGTEL